MALTLLGEHKTETQEGQPWTKNEINAELLDLTTDALHIIRSAVGYGKVSKDALLTAKWIIDHNISFLDDASKVLGPSADVVELRDVLARAKANRR